MTIAFAHRGGRKHAKENTLSAFRNAVEMGTPGIETDAWLQNGDVVLSHDRPKQGKTYPKLSELFEIAGPELPIFIDVKDLGTLAAIGATGRQNLWLAHAGFNESSWQTVESWREAAPTVTLVDSTSVARMSSYPDRYVARLKDSPIEVLNLPIREWNSEIVDLCNRAGLKTMAFRVHTKRRARKAHKLGLDAICGDDIRVLK